MDTMIVEDEPLMREMLCLACGRAGVAVVMDTDSGQVAIRELARLRPALLLLDLRLPDLSGFAVMQAARMCSPGTRIVVFSAHASEYVISRMQGNAIHGFLDKTTATFPDLRAAIEAVAANRSYFSESYRESLRRFAGDAGRFDRILSDRESAVLEFLADGIEDAGIAQRLQLSVRTVGTHRLNAERKLGLNGRRELERFAREHGFTRGLPPEPDGEKPP